MMMILTEEQVCLVEIRTMEAVSLAMTTMMAAVFLAGVMTTEGCLTRASHVKCIAVSFVRKHKFERM